MKKKLKVFTCNDFEGRWPVGTAAVVVAHDVEEATSLLDAKLRKQGLGLCGDEVVKELDLYTASAVILNNGDY